MADTAINASSQTLFSTPAGTSTSSSTTATAAACPLLAAANIAPTPPDEPASSRARTQSAYPSQPAMPIGVLS